MENRQAAKHPQKHESWWLPVSTLLMPVIVFMSLKPGALNQAVLPRLGIWLISTVNLGALIFGFLHYRALQRRCALPLGSYLKIWFMAALITDGGMALVLWLIAQKVPLVLAYLIAITFLFLGIAIVFFVRWRQLQHGRLLPTELQSPPGGPEAQ